MGEFSPQKIGSHHLLPPERLKSAENLWYYLHDITAWHRAVYYIKYTVPVKFLQSATGIILWNQMEDEGHESHDRYLELRRWLKRVVIDKLSDAGKDKRQDALSWVMRRAKPCWRAHIHPGAGLLALVMPSGSGMQQYLSKAEVSIRDGEDPRAAISH